MKILITATWNCNEKIIKIDIADCDRFSISLIVDLRRLLTAFPS